MRQGISELFTNQGSQLKLSVRNAKKPPSATTATIESLLVQLNAQTEEAIKVVKLDVPQSQWKEYGIADKR